MDNCGPLYCRPNKRGVALLKRTSACYCPGCGMRMRGSRHRLGRHHILKRKE